MKRFSLAVVLTLCLPMLLMAAQHVLTGQTRPQDVTVTVLESSAARTVVRFDVDGFTRDDIQIAGQDYVTLTCGHESVRLEAGAPALPRLSRSIVIPDDADMQIRMISSDYVDYTSTPVAPSKGNLLRTVDPATVAYVFGPVYQQAAWYPRDLASLRTPYVLRDLRGAVIDLNAFQYNPALQTLRVYTSVTVEISAAGYGGENMLARVRPFRKVDPEFERIYQRHFLNYDHTALLYTPVPENGEMLIICYDAFRTAIVPFANWKIQKGIPTTIVNVSAIGNTATAIRAYIQNFYNTHDLGYVLLVGDAEQIATPTASTGSSDPTYSKLAGSDDYPDVFVGRFSAASVADVQTQVERSVEYERDAQAGAAWYHAGTCIGSDQGPGHNGGEYDYVHEGNLRADLLNFTYTAIDQIFDPGATAAQVSAALNAGRSIINYTGHGSQTSWGTTGFSNSNVAALTNDNLLPFIFSVACVNGQFAGATCFAEAWMRSTRGGQPIGAIATYMSSINQSWNPPMDAQDEETDLLLARAKTTVGGLCYNSSCRMMDLNPGVDGADMFNTWQIFGDPSLQIRTATPVAMAVSHDGQIPFGQPSYAVSVNGVPGALCALSLAGVLYGAAYTDATGSAVITINGDLPTGQNVVLTVTAFNKLTFLADIPVIASGPDVYPPTISFVPLPTTSDAAGPYVLRATIRDYSGIAGAIFHYSFDSTTFNTQPMVRDTGFSWTASCGGYPAGTRLFYYVTATDSSENHNPATSPVYQFSVLGVLFSDNMESGAGEWTVGAIQTGWMDQWHVSAARSHSAGHAWKFGDTGTGGYASHAYGGLVSPAIFLAGDATLTFWHLIRAERSATYADSAYDGGAVDISVDSAAWQQLTALSPGYNKYTRGTSSYSGPFAGRTPVYSDSLDWTQVSMNLAAFTGHSVRLRFRFGSDNATAREGWYIDDVALLWMPPEPQTPGAVTNLTIVTDEANTTLYWAPTGAPFYKIYSAANASGPFTDLEGTTSAASFAMPAHQLQRFYFVVASSLP
ncbi:MAG TPA: C25 family cysteine peptidase [bacterium]|jgi:hypothetical protein